MSDRKVEVGLNGTVQVSVLKALQKAKLDILLELKVMLQEVDSRIGGDTDGVDEGLGWSLLGTKIEAKEKELDEVTHAIAGLTGVNLNAGVHTIRRYSMSLTGTMRALAAELDNYRNQTVPMIKALKEGLEVG